jgi:hypothetical protein
MRQLSFYKHFLKDTGLKPPSSPHYNVSGCGSEVLSTLLIYTSSWKGAVQATPTPSSYLPQYTRHVLITKCIPHHVFLQHFRDGVSLKASGNHHDHVRVFRCSEQDRHTSAVFVKATLTLTYTSIQGCGVGTQKLRLRLRLRFLDF